MRRPTLDLKWERRSYVYWNKSLVSYAQLWPLIKNAVSYFEGNHQIRSQCTWNSFNIVFLARSMALKLVNYWQKFDLIAPTRRFTSMVAPGDGFQISTSSSMGFINVFQTDLVDVTFSVKIGWGTLGTRTWGLSNKHVNVHFYFFKQFILFKKSFAHTFL